MRLLTALAVSALLLGPARAAPDPLEAQATQFVRLALSLGRIDHTAIDAYFGPPDFAVIGPALTLPALQYDLQQLAASLARDAPSPRRDRLRKRVESLGALIGLMKKPGSMSFDQEAMRIYGVAIPPPDVEGQRRTMTALDRLVPGRGDLTARLAAYRARFMIPPQRRKAVFLRALAECRARTAAHWPLPPDEKLDIVWDADTPAAWHRYQGHDVSQLRINPAAVADPGSALDVACHEAYPGHHAQFLAMAARGLRIEDTVVILRSPDQVLREGAANYGVALAFPAPARLALMRELFALAGLDPRTAARYVQIHRLVGDLALSVLPVLRDYRDGRMASGDAVAALVQAGIESPQALLQFTREMGAYVTGYTVARDLVGACVAARSRATGRDPWAVLRDIVAMPDLTALDCIPPNTGHK